jgi:hypothetical protein
MVDKIIEFDEALRLKKRKARNEKQALVDEFQEQVLEFARDNIEHLLASLENLKKFKVDIFKATEEYTSDKLRAVAHMSNDIPANILDNATIRVPLREYDQLCYIRDTIDTHKKEFRDDIVAMLSRITDYDEDD